NKQPNEQVWVNNSHFEPHGIQHATLMASPPVSLSRFAHFANNQDFRNLSPRIQQYAYPGGLDARYDLLLWGTKGMGGGAGGDWGTRVSDTSIISAANNAVTQSGEIRATNNNAYVISHEIGHGFGLYDFYGAVGTDRPPRTSNGVNFGSGDITTVMIAGGTARSITSYDEWMIRYWYTLVRDRYPGRLVA
ncbi:MAG: hypothetical protein FWG45_08110, partial [Oscillospiraceae bacterium]|nr:hypothetical protein [Oscillospiraceae bacterium]